MQAASHSRTACTAVTFYPRLHYNMPVRGIRMLLLLQLKCILTIKTRACTPTIEVRKNSTAVCAESAFSNRVHEILLASWKVVLFERTIRHPLAQRALRRAYHALSSGFVPLRCALSRDSNQARSTMPNAASGASSKYATSIYQSSNTTTRLKHIRVTCLWYIAMPHLQVGPESENLTASHSSLTSETYL